MKLDILGTNEKVDVICRLPWTWKWLQAVIKVNFDPLKNSYLNLIKDGHFQVQQYHLTPTVGAEVIKLFFISICDTIEEENKIEKDSRGGLHLKERTSFSTFLQNQPSEECSLKNTETLLNKYEIFFPSCAHQLLRYLWRNQLPGKVLSLAINQPTFLRPAPNLYPKNLASIVSWQESEDSKRTHKQEVFLRTLENFATQEPWKFGFGDIMYKRLVFLV